MRWWAAVLGEDTPHAVGDNRSCATGSQELGDRGQKRKGRAIATHRGVPAVGMAGVLLAAKKRGLLDAIVPILKHLEQAGYRMSAGLSKKIARLAGEDG